jgi:hypothetical protein
MLADGFNGERYIRRSKERSNLSKGKMDSYSDAKYLNVGDIYLESYGGALSTRYASAIEMSYDMLVSVFDINSSRSLVCRVYEPDQATMALMGKQLHSIAAKGANLEARIIGLQNGQDFNKLYGILDLLSANKAKLVEVDLFGGDTRNIAFDAKLGTTHSVLIYNRLYRVGELKNGRTIEQFERDFV